MDKRNQVPENEDQRELRPSSPEIGDEQIVPRYSTWGSWPNVKRNDFAARASSPPRIPPFTPSISSLASVASWPPPRSPPIRSRWSDSSPVPSSPSATPHPAPSVRQSRSFDNLPPTEELPVRSQSAPPSPAKMDDPMTELLLFSPTSPTTPRAPRRAPRPTNVSFDAILSRLEALEEAMETNSRWGMASSKGLGLADRIEMLEAHVDFIQRDLADATTRLESRMDKVEGRIDNLQHVSEDVNEKLEVVTRKADRLAWSVQIGDRHAAHVMNRAEVINNKVEDLRGKVQGIEDRLVAVASRTPLPQGVPLPVLPRALPARGFKARNTFFFRAPPSQGASLLVLPRALLPRWLTKAQNAFFFRALPVTGGVSSGAASGSPTPLAYKGPECL
ncbi:hypothetical protein N7535_009135 [Penicillium sp. DV-2018c]|nr:hypothetical protein N7535_009135 [Penicillium sp. DV-2018c]